LASRHLPYSSVVPQIDQDAYATIQPELLSGETVLWAGRPSAKVIFHASDRYTIPFSLMWGGFAIFWEASVVGITGFDRHTSQHPWTFGMIWGIPFVLFGQYFIWGRFIYAAWLKKRTYYAVTSRRVIAIQRGWTQKTSAGQINNLPATNKELRDDGIGTLYFGIRPTGRRGSQVSITDMRLGDVTSFVDIEDAASVYRLVSDQQGKAQQS
jgi:hypothetical protein